MKLTLELDTGETNTINLEGQPEPGERLEQLKFMCELLDLWATERDKNKEHG
jgi:hypothetical protein